MIFEVGEVDRDYNTYTGSKFIRASSEQDARAWCRKESWTGYDYVLIGQVTYASKIDEDLTAEVPTV